MPLPSTAQGKLELSLLVLRYGVALVMLMWTLDKFLRPDHAAAVYEGFYGLGGIGPSLMYALAAAELVLIAGFVLGLARTWTYGLILLFHAISTLSSWKQYLAPFEGPNLLFFAAWPMLSACIALFLLREHDRMFTIGRR
jgi:putative oxidoreductase